MYIEIKRAANSAALFIFDSNQVMNIKPQNFIGGLFSSEKQVP